MKNVKKLVLAALMVAVMAFALCSCGGSAADGTYVVTEVNGQDVESALKLYEAAGTKMTAEELCSITISGKTFSMNAMGIKAEQRCPSRRGSEVHLPAQHVHHA